MRANSTSDSALFHWQELIGPDKGQTPPGSDTSVPQVFNLSNRAVRYYSTGPFTPADIPGCAQAERRILCLHLAIPRVNVSHAQLGSKVGLSAPCIPLCYMSSRTWCCGLGVQQTSGAFGVMVTTNFWSKITDKNVAVCAQHKPRQVRAQPRLQCNGPYSQVKRGNRFKK